MLQLKKCHKLWHFSCAAAARPFFFVKALCLFFIRALLTQRFDFVPQLFLLGYLELALADQFSKLVYDRSGPHIGKNQFRDNSTTTEGFG
jgi:hypothetical protein